MVRSNLFTASLLGAAAASVADAACVKRGDNSSSSTGLVAATYFAGYHIDDGFPVSSMSWDRYTEVKYSFAETAPDGSLDISKSSPDQLPVFVAAAKENVCSNRLIYFL